MDTTSLTEAAQQGYDWQALATEQMDVRVSPETATKQCPYLNTSDMADAWHLGRFMAMNPTTELRPRVGSNISDKDRREVVAGKGDTMSLRGYKGILLGRYRMDRKRQTFTPIA